MVPVNRQLSKKTWVRGARLKEKEKKETPKDCTTKWLGCAFSLLTYRSMDKGGNRKKKIWEAGVSDPLYPCSVLSPVQAFLRKEFRALSGNQCVTSADNCDKENVCAYIGHHTKICHPPPPHKMQVNDKNNFLSTFISVWGFPCCHTSIQTSFYLRVNQAYEMTSEDISLLILYITIH